VGAATPSFSRFTLIIEQFLLLKKNSKNLWYSIFSHSKYVIMRKEMSYYKSLLDNLFHLAIIDRWNDHPKPFDISELDKQAHKVIIAYFHSHRILSLVKECF